MYACNMLCWGEYRCEFVSADLLSLFIYLICLLLHCSIPPSIHLLPLSHLHPYATHPPHSHRHPLTNTFTYSLPNPFNLQLHYKYFSLSRSLSHPFQPPTPLTDTFQSLTHFPNLFNFQLPPPLPSLHPLINTFHSLIPKLPQSLNSLPPIFSHNYQFLFYSHFLSLTHSLTLLYSSLSLPFSLPLIPPFSSSHSHSHSLALIPLSSIPSLSIVLPPSIYNLMSIPSHALSPSLPPSHPPPLSSGSARCTPSLRCWLIPPRTTALIECTWRSCTRPSCPSRPCSWKVSGLWGKVKGRGKIGRVWGGWAWVCLSVWDGHVLC